VVAVEGVRRVARDDVNLPSPLVPRLPILSVGQHIRAATYVAHFISFAQRRQDDQGRRANGATP